MSTFPAFKTKIKINTKLTFRNVQPIQNMCQVRIDFNFISETWETWHEAQLFRCIKMF